MFFFCGLQKVVDKKEGGVRNCEKNEVVVNGWPLTYIS